MDKGSLRRLTGVLVNTIPDHHGTGEDLFPVDAGEGIVVSETGSGGSGLPMSLMVALGHEVNKGLSGS